MRLPQHILKAHPASVVLAGFLLAIVLGTFLLKLPISVRSDGLAWIDALFTATSAVCVTGLVVVDTGSQFTTFGHVIILIMIQTGGLGVMTVSTALFRWLGGSISFRRRMAIQDLFAHTPRADIFGLLKSIFLITVCTELIGAVLLTIHWSRELPFLTAAGYGIFHSVSAFCNAGFALFPDSMMRYSDAPLLNSSLCFLIVVGGLGFPVLYELQSRITHRRPVRARLTVQTKTVLWTTCLLIITGAVVFGFLERGQLMETKSASHLVMTSLFQSITCRTAGFNTVDIGSLHDAALIVMIFLMFFGASPGSCGGGVKTTTLALLASFTASRIMRRPRVNMFKKSIPTETVTRSMSLILVSIAIIGMVVFMMLIGDPVTGHRIHTERGEFLSYFFETVSAFATVGLSMGVTPDLGTWGKCWIMLMMIMGRVGVLAFAYIIVGTGATYGIEYSEENLMIG